MGELERWLHAVNDWIWGPPMLILLVGTHVFLTIRLRFVQRYLGAGIRLSVERGPDGAGDVSQFGALTTSLAACIGTGNIVGVATAIAAGGPGAMFWMWITGVLGMATKYGESLLAVKYRVTMADGSMAGGPMYVLARGMNQRGLAVAFAVLTAVSGFGIGNTVQANSAATLARDTFGLPVWLTGLVLTGLTAAVILGGVRSIAAVCERLVPFMAIVYTIGCVAILVLHLAEIPDALALIVSSAFTGQAAVGGFLGAGMKEAIRFGTARGLFSNEAGMGSGAIISAAAQTRNPVRQALVAQSTVFWDTVVGCALTGLVLVSAGVWSEEGATAAGLASAAFAHLPYVGPATLTIALFTFVFATIVGWSYIGEKACEYLFGSGVVLAYRWCWVIAVLIGSVLPLRVVWAASDITNALMAIPNLIALLLLSGVIVAETRRYLWSGDLDSEGS